MNYLFVLAVVAARFGNSMSNGQHMHSELFKQYELECAKEKNVSMAALAEAEDGIFSEEANIHKFNCFAECLFYKLGFFIPGSNVLQMEEVRKQAMKKGGQTYVKIAEKCANHEGPSLCDRAFEMYKCYNLEVNKLGDPLPPGSVAGYGTVPVVPLVNKGPILLPVPSIPAGAPKEVAPADPTGAMHVDMPAALPAFSPESTGRRAAEDVAGTAPAADYADTKHTAAEHTTAEHTTAEYTAAKYPVSEDTAAEHTAAEHTAAEHTADSTTAAAPGP